MADRAQDTREQLQEVWESPPGVVGWWSKVNNQPLGKRYMITAFVFFLLAGIMALLMRTQLAVPENTFMGPETFNRLFTMHGSVMMFLFVIPFLEGLAFYIIPLMNGSRDAAFPRLTAFTYYTYLFGGIVFFASFLVDAVPDAGWFAYVPLSSPLFAGKEMEFWLLGLTMVELSGIAAGIELVITVLKLRAPGMSLNRMPLFSWAILVAAFSMAFAFTVLLTAGLMLELDFSLGTRFFEPEHGGNSILWQHLFWIFGHPEVYIMFIPAAGIVSMVVPVVARRPIAAYILVALSLIVTGFVGFGLWVHHMYATGLPELALAFFTAASFMIALASGTQIFVWIATLWGQRPAFNTAFLFVLGFIFLFLAGGITGVMVAVVPFDWQVHDTYFLVAHFHYVLVGGVVFPIFAGIYYWFPKITGRMLNETLGKWNFWLLFLGVNVTFFVMHLTGMQGMPRRVYTYAEELGLGTHNMISTIGGFVIGLGALVFLVNVWLSLRNGKRAPADPWGGETIEWSIPSPPPIYAYFRPLVVRSRHPVWEQNLSEASEEPLTEEEEEGETETVKRVTRAMTGGPLEFRATLIGNALTGEPQAIHYLSGPTHVPLFTALGVLLTLVSVLAEVYLMAAVGAVFTIGMVVYWLWTGANVLESIRSSDISERSGLPVFKKGSDSPGWWGAILTVASVATAFLVLYFSYFYIWSFSEEWPQEGLPLPELGLPGIALALLLISVAPMVWSRWSLRRERTGAFKFGVALCTVLGLAFLVLQVLLLVRAEFTPQTNAYASFYFVIIGLLCLVVAAGLMFQLATLFRAFRGDLEERYQSFFPVQIQITSLFWYFTVAAGLATFLVIHVSPHL